MSGESYDNMGHETHGPHQNEDQWNNREWCIRKKYIQHHRYHSIRESPDHIDDISTSEISSDKIPSRHPEKKYDTECEKNWKHRII